MTYYDIIKTRKYIYACEEEIEKIKKPIDYTIYWYIKKKQESCSSLIDKLLASIYLDTFSEYKSGLYYDSYSKIRSPYLSIYNVGNYIYISRPVWGNNYFSTNNIFSFGNAGPLIPAVLIYLMDYLNLNDPFDILNRDLKKIDKLLPYILNELIYSSGDVFYGSYNYGHGDQIIKNKSKKQIIHKLKIKYNNCYDLRFKYVSRNTLNIIQYQSKPLLVFEQENKKLINSGKMGWDFFLSKQHVRDSIIEAKNMIKSDLNYILLSEINKKQGLESDIRRKKREIRNLKKRKKTLSYEIIL